MVGFQTAQSWSTERTTGVRLSAKALIFLRPPRPNHVWDTRILLNAENRDHPTGGTEPGMRSRLQTSN